MLVKIRKFKKSDSKEISNLILKIFKEDNLEDVSKKGLRFFTEMHSPENISKTWVGTYVLVGEDLGKIVAVARAKPNGWNTHLFVDKKYRSKGIAGRLDKMREDYHRKIGNREIKINSSPFSLEHHRRLGYSLSGEKSFYHGIPIIPMIKILGN